MSTPRGDQRFDQEEVGTLTTPGREKMHGYYLRNEQHTAGFLAKGKKDLFPHSYWEYYQKKKRGS